MVFFQFADTDSVFGGLTVSKEGNAQTISLTAVNYNLHLGGKYKIPFQVFISETETTGDNTEDANVAKLLTPESGFAIKFPLLWIYQSSGDEICSFMDTNNPEQKDNIVGHCAVGGDITINYKTLKGEDDKEEDAYGITARIGASLLFPVLEPSAKTLTESKSQGYLALSAKLVYAKTNIDDPSLIFTPIMDAEGNAIAFDESIFSYELGVKFSIQDKFAVSAKWMKPMGGHEYLDDIVSISIDTQF
jgi:hypothetical protein